MSDLIRMTPEEVRASANQYRRQAEAVDGVIGDMDSMLTHLQSQWEGNSSRSFASRYAELKPGFIKAMWCGCQECEDAVKEEIGVTSRCIPFEQETLADTCVYCGKPAKKMVYWGKAY